VTPVSDDSGKWIEPLVGLVSILWAFLAVAWGWMAKQVAMKSWVKEQINEFAKEDHLADRQMFIDLVAPVLSELAAAKGETAERHRQNSNHLDKIEAQNHAISRQLDLVIRRGDE
jgi:hypothetical protein